MRPFEHEKQILPAFPKTPHLPHRPNASGDDCIASFEAAQAIFRYPVNIEEKVDAASMGIADHRGEPVIRNRGHIMRKGSLQVGAGIDPHAAS